MLPPSTLLKDGRIKQGKQGWASSWTDPPRPRPPRWVFLATQGELQGAFTHARFCGKVFPGSAAGRNGKLWTVSWA